MNLAKLERKFTDAADDYQHQLDHGGLGDIESASIELDKIGAELDAATTATLEVAKGEKKMHKITNANLSGGAAHFHKDLFGRIVNAVDLDPAGIKIAISKKYKTSRFEDGKVIIREGLGLHEMLTDFVATMRYARRLLDFPNANEELPIQELRKLSRTYAEERLTEIRAALTEEERKDWDSQAFDIEVRNKERAAAKEKHREEMAMMPISEAEKGMKSNEKRKLEILAAMAENITYEYSWRVEELGVVGYLEKHFASWLHFCSPENNEKIAAAMNDEQRVTVYLGMAKSLQAEEIRSLVKFRRWASGGSPGSHIDELAKAQAGAQFAEWLDDVIEATSSWLGFERKNGQSFRTLGW